MIVSPLFNGDENMDSAWKQHDVYGDALHIMVSTCNRYALFAKAVLEDTNHIEWGTIRTFDHRVLQGAHDLLAAAWRQKNDTRQRKLPFVEAERRISVESLWLEWLRREVSGWIDQPDLVRSVQLILANQNKPIGNLAECRLGLDIMDRFCGVPWSKSWRDAYEKSLLQSMDKLRIASAPALPEE